MITKLEIHNYESHKRTILNFPSPGLTVFIGESDKGKSGAFRAFDFARSNLPLGKDMFPLFWSGITKVKVVFDTLEEIVRTKGEGVNNYTIIIPGQEPKEFNASSKVPEEVSSLFNMEEINFQSQIDRSFLMFDTAGQRGRILNKIVGLDSIDITLSAAKRDVGKLKQEKGNQKNITEELEKKIEKYESLSDIEDLLNQGDELERKQHQINSVISGVRRIQKELIEVSDKLKPFDKLPTVQESFDKLKSLSKEQSEIEEDISTVLDIQKELTKKRKRFKNINKTDEMLDCLDELKERQEDAWKIINIIDAIKQIQIKIQLANRRLKSKTEEAEKMKTRIPDVCSYCGSSIKK